jgi:hypothetical protein
MMQVKATGLGCDSGEARNSLDAIIKIRISIAAIARTNIRNAIVNPIGGNPPIVNL